MTNNDDSKMHCGSLDKSFTTFRRLKTDYGPSSYFMKTPNVPFTYKGHLSANLTMSQEQSLCGRMELALSRQEPGFFRS